MNRIIRSMLFALGAAGAMTLALAQIPRELPVGTIGVEAPSGQVILPSSIPGTVTVPPCGGCPPRNVLATEKSRFFLGSREVTFADLKAAVAGKQDLLLGVGWTNTTGELVIIIGPAEAPAQRTNAR